ncbi:MAG: acyl-CoA thioesterase [Alphaproteobacteria bacterium]|nr:acyl-CoA thioesterase [Alphaproteobacteria bacterium]
MTERKIEPRGILATRTLAMPADANPQGDIFGGWVLAQMDIAGGITAIQRSGGRAVTAAIDKMSFHLPVFVGDVLSVYADVLRIGRSSMTIHLEAWAERGTSGEAAQVTEGTFVFVAIDDEGRPRPIQGEAS